MLFRKYLLSKREEESQSWGRRVHRGTTWSDHDKWTWRRDRSYRIGRRGKSFIIRGLNGKRRVEWVVIVVVFNMVAAETFDVEEGAMEIFETASWVKSTLG